MKSSNRKKQSKREGFFVRASNALINPRHRLWLVLGCVLLVAAVVTMLWRRSLGALRSSGNDLRIGAILPQTGPGAVFAQYIEEGMDLAVEDINRQSRHHVQVLYEDSKNQPKEGLTVYNKLVSTENPPVVIVALSSVAKALAPLAEQSNTAQVYVAVAIPDITDGKYKFRIYPEAAGMAGVMASFSRQKLGAKTSAVVYLNDDFGRVSLEAYTREMQKAGGDVIFSESYELQQTDFRSLISKLKSVTPEPDVIYLSGYGPSYGVFIKQLKEQDVQVPLTADMTLGMPDTLQQIGSAADGAYFVDGKMSPKFVKHFSERYGKEPSSYAGYAYDVIAVLHRKTEESGSVTVDTIRRELLNVKDYEGVMGRINMKQDGNSNLQFVVKRVTGQSNVVVSE